MSKLELKLPVTSQQHLILYRKGAFGQRRASAGQEELTNIQISAEVWAFHSVLQKSEAARLEIGSGPPDGVFCSLS